MRKRCKESEIEEATATARCPGRLTGTSTSLIAWTMDCGRVYVKTSENIKLGPKSRLVALPDIENQVSDKRDSADAHKFPRREQYLGIAEELRIVVLEL